MTNTFALVPPRRPTVADFGGGAWEDDPVYPPDPATMPSAAALNATAEALAAMAAVCPVAVLSIRYDGTNVPYIYRATTPAGWAPTRFSVTEVVPGYLTVSWPDDTFPPSVAEPTAALNDTTPARAAVCGYLDGTSLQIHTANGAGTGARIPVTVTIF